MTKTQKTWLIAAFAVVIVFALVGSIWALSANSRQEALDAEYQEGLTQLQDQANQMAYTLMAYQDLANSLDLTEAQREYTEGIFDESLEILRASTEVITTSPEVYTLIKENTLQDKSESFIYDKLFHNLTLSEKAQSVVADTSDVQQSNSTEDSQSGLDPLPDVALVMNELFPTDEESQSNDPSSSQSGDEVDEIIFEFTTIPPAKITKEDINDIDICLININSYDQLLKESAYSLVVKVYRDLIDEDTTKYNNAVKDLNATITAAEKTLKDSEGKVSDNKVRETLRKAIDEALKVVDKPLDLGATPSLIKEQSAIITDNINAINAAVKNVTDAVTAKTKADKEAAEAAAREANAEQNTNYTDNDYSDYGYSDNNYTSGGNSYSGGSSSSGNSGGSSSGGSSSGGSGGGGGGGGSSFGPYANGWMGSGCPNYPDGGMIHYLPENGWTEASARADCGL